MTHAPSTTSFPPHGDGSIIGCFREKDHGKFFEFSINDEDFYLHYPHKVWVTTPWYMDEGWRFAKVLKTVAYVLTNDEDDFPDLTKKKKRLKWYNDLTFGYDVVEQWYIKSHREYDRKLG